MRTFRSRSTGAGAGARASAPYLVAWIVAACVGGYIALRMSVPAGSVTRLRVDVIVLTVFCAVSAVALWLASRRSAARPRTASGWRWLSASFVVISVGSGITLIYQISDQALPYPSLVDALYVCYYPLIVVGLLRFSAPWESRSDGYRLLIDAAMVVIGAASVIWLFVVGPLVTQPGLSPLLIATLGATPVGDVLVLFAVLYVIMRGRARTTSTALRLLAAGAALVAASDVANGWLRLHDELVLLEYLSVAYVIVAAIFIVSAGFQQRLHSDHADGPQIDLGQAAGASKYAPWLPYLAPAVVFVLLVTTSSGSPAYERVGLAACAAVLAGLVLLRQFLVQRDLLSAQGQLSYLALHDALTGLPNRALVLDRAEQLLARARRQDAPVAALFIDLDGFKYVNDSFGHAAGDALLKVVAERLADLTRESDTVGRLGGDEFVVLLDSPTLDVAPELVAERMLERLRQPIELKGAGERPLAVSASIGVAIGMNESADELLSNADLALYEAKNAGKDRLVVFESGMQTIATDRLLLEMDLRDAVEEQQFFLLYQPTFDLRSETITGVEALVRWRHPSRGVMSPGLFLDLAEETGIILELGQWVMNEACRQAADWRAGGRAIDLSVNVSGRQFDAGAQFVEQVRDALQTSGLEPSALTLEVTEAVLMRDPALATKRLEALKALGVRVAIDNFGTGYSSMAYLQQLPVDALKIDHSLISGIAATRASAAIVGSLVQLGRTLNLETLGEGIEARAQLHNLQHERCDSGQGFLFARPLEPDQIESLIDDAVAPASR